MSVTRSIRYATIAVLAAVAMVWGQAGAAPPSDAAEVLEVKVLGVEVSQEQQDDVDILYRMEVLSILRSASGVKPGEIVTVRSHGPIDEVLEPGWIGNAYVNPDPRAAGAGRQFATAGDNDGLEQLPPAPPSATWTREAPTDDQ
jgi:hypothetical protein